MRFFLILGSIVFGAGFLVGARFLYFLAAGTGTGHIQSLILASMLMMIGFMTWVVGLLADLISVNRRLLEEANARLWKLEQAVKNGSDSGRPK